MPEQEYQGVPLRQLRIETIHWTESATNHIKTRTQRYPGRGELDLEAEWATEAALDPLRLVGTTGGLSIEIIGWSRSALPRPEESGGRLLKVWLIPNDDEEGAWFGASACAANHDERKSYEEVNYE